MIYGNGSPNSPGGRSNPANVRIMVQTPFNELIREINANKLPAINGLESRVYDLTVEQDYPPGNIKAGDVLRVVPSDLQMHPVVEGKIICCNFVRYHHERVLKIPLRYTNLELSIAMKRGAFVVAANRFVNVKVDDGAKIPEFVAVDLTDANLKEKIRRSRLVLPEGCSWGENVTEDFLVGSVFGRAKLMAD